MPAMKRRYKAHKKEHMFEVPASFVPMPGRGPKMRRARFSRLSLSPLVSCRREGGQCPQCSANTMRTEENADFRAAARFSQCGPEHICWSSPFFPVCPFSFFPATARAGDVSRMLREYTAHKRNRPISELLCVFPGLSFLPVFPCPDAQHVQKGKPILEQPVVPRQSLLPRLFVLPPRGRGAMPRM